jgi:hypothetical protein
MKENEVGAYLRWEAARNLGRGAHRRLEFQSHSTHSTKHAAT